MNQPVIYGAVGIALAVVFARILRLPVVRDASRRHAVALLVVAVIYVVFAAVGGSAGGVATEMVGVAAFGGIALVGLRRRSPALLALGWALHPVWDVALHSSGAGLVYTPHGYVSLCIGFDLALALLIATGRAGAATRTTVVAG
jgi:hypothetical protein